MTGMADNHRESWAGLIAEAERYRRRTGNEVVLITAFRAPQPGGFSYAQHGCGALGDAARRYLEDIAVVHKTTAFSYAPAPARPGPSQPRQPQLPPPGPPRRPPLDSGRPGSPGRGRGGAGRRGGGGGEKRAGAQGGGGRREAAAAPQRHHG
ncbi:proline-rich AKT1 substrate 1-like [Mauremys reevesii]|uniref:proline-rich AKT1 substrate 1-like n=1 Tax=Mauremys reevesii TaxID=260615 RepID=UPI00193FD895|nr:proline-rich AKT1 substrate 1-like [Mauremys reevesii]